MEEGSLAAVQVGSLAGEEGSLAGEEGSLAAVQERYRLPGAGTGEVFHSSLETQGRKRVRKGTKRSACWRTEQRRE